MGYNNNHAGLHLIRMRRSGFGWIGDSYYDRYQDIITEQMQKRHAQTVELEKDVDEIHLNNNEKDLATQDSPKIENPQSKTEAPSTKKPERKPVPSRKKEDSMSGYTVSDRDPKELAIKYGTEELLEIQDFLHYEYVMANIMAIAVKNKKDIFGILRECESLMRKDRRANPVPEEELYRFPKLFFMMVFLNLLAERLECEVYEFFIDNDRTRKRFAYQMVDYAREHKEDCDIDIDDSGFTVISMSSIDQRLEMTQENRMHGFFPDGEIWRMMDLTFEKEIFDDGPNYSVAFGSLCIAPCTREKYCSEGAYLYEEEDGRIKDFVEEMISAEKTVEGNT